MRAISGHRSSDPRYVALRALVVVIGGLAALVAMALADLARDGGLERGLPPYDSPY